MSDAIGKKLSEIEHLISQIRDFFDREIIHTDWYSRKEMDRIEHPTLEEHFLTPEESFEEILERIKKLRSETNNKKLLSGLSLVQHLLIQAVEEFERIKRFIPLLERLYELLDHPNAVTRKSAGQCRLRAIDLCFGGSEVPVLKISKEGICKLDRNGNETPTTIQESKVPPTTEVKPFPKESRVIPYDNSELISLAGKLVQIESTKNYACLLNTTIESLEQKLEEYDKSSHSVKQYDRLVQRAYFMLDLISNSTQLNDHFVQTIEYQETVDVKIPSEQVIFLVMVYNLTHPEIPLRFDVVNRRLYPG